MRRYPLVEKLSGLSLALDESVPDAADVLLVQDGAELRERLRRGSSSAQIIASRSRMVSAM
jgi:hypothetical protein